MFFSQSCRCGYPGTAAGVLLCASTVAVPTLVAASTLLCQKRVEARAETLPSQGLRWVVEKGDNAVVAVPDTLAVSRIATTATSQPARATARLGVLLRAKNNPWSISFKVKFGPLSSQPSSVYLLSDTSQVIGVEGGVYETGGDAKTGSAGGATGRITVYVGNGRKAAFTFSRNANVREDWHTLRFVGNAGDKDVIVVWHNGAKVAEVPCADVPNQICVGSLPPDPPAGRQTSVALSQLKINGKRPEWKNVATAAPIASQPSASGATSTGISREATTQAVVTPTTSSVTVTPPALPVAQNPQVVYDDFRTGAPLPGLWDGDANNGGVLYQQGELMLSPSRRNDNFPCLVTRRGAFPPGSSWKVTIRFRFPRRGASGVGFRIVNASNDGFIAHYDDNLGVPNFTLASRRELMNQNSDPSAWHEAVIVNNAGSWSASLDGAPPFASGILRSQQEGYDLLIGHNGPQVQPSNWTTLSLQSVRIEWTAGPRPSWLGDVLATTR